MLYFGVDLGGTKTEIICLNADNGKELYRQRVPSPQNDYKATVRNMAGLVLAAEKTLGEKGTVGVGIPGAFFHDFAFSRPLLANLFRVCDQRPVDFHAVLLSQHRIGFCQLGIDAELVLLEPGGDIRVRLGVDVGVDAERDAIRNRP